MYLSSPKPGHLICGLVLALCCIGSPVELLGQCEVQKLSVSDSTPYVEFGVSVSVSGDVAVVGAHYASCTAVPGCGKAYVYRSNGLSWIEEQKLTAGDIELRAFFGTSVSVGGNVILVGADSRDCNAGVDCGAAYVYRYNGLRWVQEQKLRAFVQAAGNLFGSSVAVSGDVAVIGAPGEDCAAGTDCGAAYVYRFNGSWWEQEQELASLEPMRNDRFGGAVGVSGNVAVVGAIGGDDCAMGSNCGTAFVYQFDGVMWVLQQELRASDGASGDRFGGSISVAKNIVVVGAPYADCPQFYDCGAAYVYRFDGSIWIEAQKLKGSDERGGDRFGYSVSASGDGGFVLVGAPSNYHDGYYGGAAYLFRQGPAGWVEEAKLIAAHFYAGSGFGTSVSIDGSVGLVGGPWENFACYGCGAAHLFAFGPDCNANGEADFCDIRDGRSRDVDGDGIPDECEVSTAALDIKPGACPNPFNPKSRGVTSVALVGSDALDVTEIDTGSLLLLRPTSHGGRVRPLSDPPGHGPRIADVVIFFDAPPCDCLPQGRDGHDDLILKFSTSEMVEALDLEASAAGDSVMLTLTGFLNDGRPFEASDCIVTTRPFRNAVGDAFKEPKLTRGVATCPAYYGPALEP